MQDLKLLCHNPNTGLKAERDFDILNIIPAGMLSGRYQLNAKILLLDIPVITLRFQNICRDTSC